MARPPLIPPDLLERFRKIAPHWAEHLSAFDVMRNSDDYHRLITQFRTDGKLYDLTSPHSCIVADAHGRTNGYRYGDRGYGGDACHACLNFSFTLDHIFLSDFPAVLRAFCSHYEAVHQK